MRQGHYTHEFTAAVTESQVLRKIKPDKMQAQMTEDSQSSHHTGELIGARWLGERQSWVSSDVAPEKLPVVPVNSPTPEHLVASSDGLKWVFKGEYMKLGRGERGHAKEDRFN